MMHTAVSTTHTIDDVTGRASYHIMHTHLLQGSKAVGSGDFFTHFLTQSIT
jgi:hypothetical protein